MSEIICTISLGDGVLDNDYTVYSDGKIFRLYDRSPAPNNYNIEEWLTASQLDDTTKRKILEKCPSEHKEKVRGILFP